MNIYQFIAQAPGSGIQGMIIPLLLIVIFWVLMIRPQQKRAKALRERQANLKKGDNVITIGGMHASVNSVNDNDATVSLKISEGNYVKYDKTAIATVLNKDETSDKA